jgi:hypothetical protein
MRRRRRKRRYITSGPYPSLTWLTLMVMLHLKLYSVFTSLRSSPVSSDFILSSSLSPNISATAGTSRHNVCKIWEKHSSSS